MLRADLYVRATYISVTSATDADSRLCFLSAIRRPFLCPEAGPHDRSIADAACKLIRAATRRRACSDAAAYIQRDGTNSTLGRGAEIWQLLTTRLRQRLFRKTEAAPMLSPTVLAEEVA